MADLEEAFNINKFDIIPIHNIDYFFTQRTMVEENEYFDKNMNRKIKKNKVTHNFLAINIPINVELDKTFLKNKMGNKIVKIGCKTSKFEYSNGLDNETNTNQVNNTDHESEKSIEQINYMPQGLTQTSYSSLEHSNITIIFDIEIFGDDGYYYKGKLTSYSGIVPNFMISIKNDKKIFIHINYNFIDKHDNLIFVKKFTSFIEVPKRFQ